MGDKHWLESLLPVYGMTFEMSFTQSCTPGFFHQAALTAWVRRLLHSPADYDLYMTMDVPEQGKSHYRAGEHYTFTLFGTGKTGIDWLMRLAIMLANGDGGLRWDKPMPFRDNWTLERISSWPDHKTISQTDALPCIDMDAIGKQVACLREQKHFCIRLISPWRVLKNKAEKGGLRGEMRFCRDNEHLFQAEEEPLWLLRIGDALRNLARRRGGQPPARSEVKPLSAHPDLFWVNASYRDMDGNHKPMGGLMGCISGINPADLPESQLWLLVAGQYLGIGQRRAFGYGRYQLLDAQNKPLFKRNPVLNILQQAMQEENLNQAQSVIIDNRNEDDAEGFGEDGQSISDASPAIASEGDRIAKMAARLLHGNYSPPPLNGFVHEDADGGLRPLAAPPVYDRILQRAVHQVLAPMLDGIMSQGSYGFRAGRSRYQVRDLIQRLYREGYRWVFESDIRSFFDTVDWHRLENRLFSLLGEEAAIDAVMQWIQQPVRWQGALIERNRGLPQGSPLSPLLANLMLDDFDHDLCDNGCQLIRFADDFVIVAKSRQQAKRGESLARKALQDVGLSLNAEKTRVVSFSEGFRFLGFTFVDGMAVESRPHRSDDAGKPPPQSWLAKAIQPQAAACDENLLRGEQAVPLAPYIDTKRLFVFCGEPTLLFTRSGSLCVERDNELVARMPWQHLDAVILFGRHQITTPALHEAMRQDVPIHMAGISGRYLGVAASGRAGYDLSASWLDQQMRFSDQSWALNAARSLVDARIRHMSETLRRRQALNVSGWQPGMEAALRQLVQAGASDELNGIEGNATKIYFAQLKRLVPAEFGFEARRRRPPPDPFNALLSFGYTLLYAYVDSLIRSDGLLPVMGFYHCSRGNHSALASDLMEPFRHVVEREALNMLQGGRLKQEDFTVRDGACRLSSSGRRLYVGALIAAFLKPLKAHGSSESVSVLEHIHAQNLNLKFTLCGKNSEFQAWRMR